jgi:hypothetical protein
MLHVLISPPVEPAHLTTLQVCVRSASVLGCAALIRVAARRFPSEATTFDLALSLLLGWTVSWTINAPSLLVAAVACVILLVLGYRLTRRIFGPDPGLDDSAPPVRQSGDGISVLSRR